MDDEGVKNGTTCSNLRRRWNWRWQSKVEIAIVG